METGNGKWVLDPPSNPQNLDPNYNKKRAQQVQERKMLPAHALSKQALRRNLEKEFREAQT